MDTSKLKKFAPQARNLLIDQTGVKLHSVLAEDSAARRENPKAVAELESQLRALGEQALIEKVAYIWFNRLTALRFMDASGLNTLLVVSPAEGQSQPQILAEAMAGHIDTSIVPEPTAKRVQALLSGAAASASPQDEAYRLLLVAACNHWHSAMPFMFEKIADYTELLMPTGLLAPDSVLARLREVMTDEACQDVEIIGWLYQFYISEKKDAVFAGLKKNQKITAENIPAATQLFTPHWIVRYLVENSLGRLWLLNRPGSKLAERMEYYIAPEEPETDFLKITRPEEIRICDPACGSGHMLTYAFDLLYAIYEEEGYDPAEIPAKILTHNLTGVEIDDRAGVLAAFALAMKASARLGRRRFLRMEAKPDIVVLQNVTFTPAEMEDVAAVVGQDLFTDELRETLGQFEQAKNFGSLIVPKLRDPAETLRVVAARDFGGDLLLKEVQERVVAVLHMAEALSPKYHVVVANPPYMGAKSMDSALSEFARAQYPDSRFDLFAMFMERALSVSRKHATVGMVNMQGWMFASSLEGLRSKLLSNASIATMAHIGTRGFDTISGEVVSTTAFTLLSDGMRDLQGIYLRLIDGRSEAEKARLAKSAISNGTNKYSFSTAEIEKIPGQPIAYWLSEAMTSAFRVGDPVSETMGLKAGLSTGDNTIFQRQWHEVTSNSSAINSPKTDDKKWFPCHSGGAYRKWYGNHEVVVNWEDDGREVRRFGADEGRIRSAIRNETFYFKPGVTWSKISSGRFDARLRPSGFLFDDTGRSGFAASRDVEKACLGMFCSTVANEFLTVLCPSMSFTSTELGMLPFDMQAAHPCLDGVERLINIAKSDWDAYETSWDFTTLPLLSPDHRGETLEDSYATLRAHWQSMTGEMQRLEEENNRIFILAYGLQDELTPEVPIEEITLTCNPAYRYGIKNDAEANETRLRADTLAEFLSYAVGCMFGRYSLDEPGLILANQGQTLEEYLKRVPEPSFTPDDDNVIPVLDGDWFADDISERFRKFLRVTFGEEKFAENLRFVEEALGKDIRKYFTRDFYNDHVKRYKKRPIYWMFSSPKGSFNALIYMHRYRPDTVSVVLNDYLREYIRKLEAHREQQERVQADPAASASAQTKAAREIEATAKILAELEAYERDVLYPLATQRVEIDLDDGVKANYPKFGAALKPIKGLSD